MSRLTDLLSRYAAHRQPLDLRLLEAIIKQDRFTGSITTHYRNGTPRLLEAGKPIVVEVQSSTDTVTLPATPLAADLTNRPT